MDISKFLLDVLGEEGLEVIGLFFAEKFELEFPKCIFII
jgi:hypothetical protein